MDGGPLAASAVGTTIAREIARQLVAGVASLHDHGIAWRDAKPGNVLLREGIDLGSVLAEHEPADDDISEGGENIFPPSKVDLGKSESFPQRLKSKGFVKLADFGITGKIEDLDAAELFGTVSYFSPEMIRVAMIEKEQLYNPVWQQGDLWALGLTLAQLFVGWSNLFER